MTRKQIKALRSSRHWLQKDLAVACGVSVRTVQGWESKRAIRPNGAARAILKLLSKSSTL